MHVYLLVIAFLGAMALGAPAPTETAAVVRPVKVAKEDNRDSKTDSNGKNVFFADGF
ncbi:unnamed protein product [Penicillium roqueforti FM164]|uniref:Uncharacterized protein n=1 Tax=Penicillium roqueforti (strain FM164) TaxID=1365484 RepID=W6QTU0_PENRF|nr:unnamed protein product [Penicillium roqueforti FM164]